jgi:hypothetical protein
MAEWFPSMDFREGEAPGGQAIDMLQRACHGRATNLGWMEADSTRLCTRLISLACAWIRASDRASARASWIFKLSICSCIYHLKKFSLIFHAQVNRLILEKSA